jgi:hypothetical protein
MALKDEGVATGLVTLQTRSRLSWLLPPAVRDAGAVVVLHDPGWIGPGLFGHRVAALSR